MSHPWLICMASPQGRGKNAGSTFQSSLSGRVGGAGSDHGGVGFLFHEYHGRKRDKIKRVTLRVKSEVAQSRLTLCNLMDCILPGSSVQGIFQARVLEWVAISFSRGSS